MQWRLIDRITDFQPWVELRADKAVSLEEYYLKERLGQPGEMPEVLLLEAGIQAAQWLVAASSDFTQHALVETVAGFTVRRPLLPGERGNIMIKVKNREPLNITMTCSCKVNGESVISGELSFTLSALTDYWIPGERKSLWREIFRPKEEQ